MHIGALEKVLNGPYCLPLSPLVFNFKALKHKGSQSKQQRNTKEKAVFD